jgi:hypothetical protein
MQNKVFNPLLNETFVFRPIVEYRDNPSTLRYADGKWLPDNGQPDLAFVQYNSLAYGVHLPTHYNLLWYWTDMQLVKKWLPEYLHQKTYGWHYMTIDDTPLTDEYKRFTFPNDDTHPNAVAFQSAMDKCCEIYNCANGRGANLTDGQYDIGKYWKADEYIKRGILLIQKTRQPITIPKELACYLCKDNGKGHLLEALESYKEDTSYKIEYNREQIKKSKTTIYDCEDEIEQLEKTFTEVVIEINKLR